MVYDPRIHTPSPPVQTRIGPPAGKETASGICTWYSPALGCYLHTLRGLAPITPTSDAGPPYNADDYHRARQNINAELAQLNRQIADCYDNIGHVNRWLHNLEKHNPPAGIPGI